MSKPELHKETSLPLWAQERFGQLRRELEQQKDENQRLQNLHQLMTNRSWFTIPGPAFEDEQNRRKLWYLDRDNPVLICTMGPGDTILIGRAKKD